MIRITFLGTAAARPTVGRNVSALAVQREGESFLFDCGEGTQRQMMRFGTGFTLNRIFFTHMHADHILGAVGLLRTMALQGRSAPLTLYGPRGSGRTLRELVEVGIERVGFPLRTVELSPGEGVEEEEYRIVAYDVDHGTPAVGYILRERDRRGRFDVERARALGIPEGPLYGRLHRGEAVEVGGKRIEADAVVGPPRPGRTVVYSGDTRPCVGTFQAAEDADLLIHDATFGDEEADRARETFHTTAREAGEIARRAGVRRLVLTHLSARYSDRPRVLEAEAREEFPEARVAWDGHVVEIPYRDGEAESGSEGVP